MAYDNLFEPLRIAGCTIPNRIARSAHSTGTEGDDLIAYHERRAQGGVGLIILEIAGVRLDSATRIPVFDDSVLPLYDEIATRLHAHGTQVFQQLWHGGAAARRSPKLIAPSAIPNPTVGRIPTEMTQGEIDDVVESFAHAARRCEQGGLDGVELHGAHGYLICQFLSPALNIRTDGYGGSTENRVRFAREIIEAIRSETSAGFPVGIRLSADDLIEGGMDPVETAAVARLLEPTLDFVDVSLGSYWRFHKLLSTLDDPLGYELESSEVVTKAVQVPTIVTGRIMTLDHASHLVESGTADMVSMVRALIADPDLVTKARSGREAEVRPCIGTSMGCVGLLMSTGKMECVVNVSAGAENTIPFEPEPEPGAEPKTVVVVGGGPAGLEAARTAALRGHNVSLYEMTNELGGQVRMAASAPHRSDLGAITGFLTDELERLGVAVHLRTPVDPDLLTELAPDEVILATGTTPRRDGFQISSPSVPVSGADLPHVVTSWDVLGFGGRATVGANAIVFDDTGTFEAISIVDSLMDQGAKVTLLSRHEQLGAKVPYPPATVEASRERLLLAGCEFVPHVALKEIDANQVTVRAQGTYQEGQYPADTVVIVSYHHANNELAQWLEQEMPDAAWNLHLVGDANGTNSIHAAVREGATIARAI